MFLTRLTALSSAARTDIAELSLQARRPQAPSTDSRAEFTKIKIPARHRLLQLLVRRH